MDGNKKIYDERNIKWVKINIIWSRNQLYMPPKGKLIREKEKKYKEILLIKIFLKEKIIIFQFLIYQKKFVKEGNLFYPTISYYFGFREHDYKKFSE